jgi:nucleotide-binding universal stress UspA family protein
MPADDAAPPLTSVNAGRPLGGQSLASRTVELERGAANLDSLQARGRPMYKHILLPTDGSELAHKAVRQGLELAKALNASATAIIVSAPWPVGEMGGGMVVAVPVLEYDSAVAKEADRVLAEVSDLAAKIGVACTTLHVPNQYPAEGIVEQANARGCDLIVMASHGRRGLAKLMLGSQAARVLAYSTVPVLICK